MADNDPLGDVFTLFAAPLAGSIRSIEQFRTGVDEFLRGVENFNRTMENLNETAERINGLLEEVEEPIRASLPQVTRTVKVADEMMQVVAGPAMAVAPSLTTLAETLNSPAFQQVPGQLIQLNTVLSEVISRLGPLDRLAESAGGLLGGLRLPGFGTTPPATPTSGSTSAATPPSERPPELIDADRAARRVRTAPAKDVPTDQPAAKQTAAKKRTVKSASAKTSKPKARAKTTPKPKAKKAAKKTADKKVAKKAAAKTPAAKEPSSDVERPPAADAGEVTP